MKVQHRIIIHTLILFLSGSFLRVSPAVSCSTFMLSRKNCLIVAHNLDQSFYTPGMIHVNRRGEKKRSVSCFDLQITDKKPPILEWTAKYGSVTFSLLGRNLPDGGMNEAGLTVRWLQYQLDNYATVAEVLEHLQDINIEPSSTFTPPASAN